MMFPGILITTPLYLGDVFVDTLYKRYKLECILDG